MRIVEETLEITGESIDEAAFDRAMEKIFAFQRNRCPDTTGEIARWQAEGLMPEQDGKLLVWKCVYPSVTRHRWHGKAGWTYRIGKTYECPGSMVGAGPFGVLKTYVRMATPLQWSVVSQSPTGETTIKIYDRTGKIFLVYTSPTLWPDGVYGKMEQLTKTLHLRPLISQGHVLAILADKDKLRAVNHDIPGVFLAPVGLPVAAYTATRVSEEEFDFKLLESHNELDPLAWIMAELDRSAFPIL